MVWARSVFVAVAVALTPAALAQVATTVNQVAPQSARAAASTLAQVGRTTSSDSVGVAQLPRDLSERPDGSQWLGTTADAAAVSQGYTLTEQGRNAGSVDADEIARLLDRGEAASIDAAAAIASGAAPQVAGPSALIEEEDAALRRAVNALAAVPRT